MDAASAREAGRLLRAKAEERRGAIVAFCQDLVRIPSPSGDEGRAAKHVLGKMRELGLSEARLDAWGNVTGVVPSRASDRREEAILLNAHLDHVDPGPDSDWTFGPFSGRLEDGRIHGRGATDTKSSVVAQVVGAALLAELGAAFPRRRDVVVAAVVQEEIGGLGSAGLIEEGRRYHAAVIGEPSENALAHGHRGRIEVEITFHGRAAHASRPDWADNPHPAMARFIPLLDELAHDIDARFGRSSVAPTLVHARPASPNVIPSDLVLTLDWRNVSSESPEVVRERLEAIAQKASLPGVSIRVRTPTRLLTSWTGQTREMERVSHAFSTAPESLLFAGARRALAEGLERDVPAMAWDFASDGGWLATAGIPCVGFGPGDLRAMHVRDESVSVDLLVEACAGNALLALALDDAPAPAREAA